MATLTIIPVSLATANAYVTQFHRHNKKVPGAKFCLGVCDPTGLLRGVCIVGRPVARLLDTGHTLEVTRLATDGCPNACSCLYNAARRVAFAMGYTKVITYTLQAESGASLRGAGWQMVAEREGSQGWLNRSGRVAQAVYLFPKYRWETTSSSSFPLIVYPWDSTLPEQPL